MIAEVVFDLPLDHPFSYLVPGDLKLACGQRVRAPLGGRGTRVGVVVALREGDESGLRPIQHVVDAAPIVSAAGLALGRW
ncbi:MAG TPA: primosomal protein N', partial [Methylomirabilota bacterium]|nr:primosomal protein N' [Methylomirabilota bacterium]